MCAQCCIVLSMVARACTSTLLVYMKLEFFSHTITSFQCVSQLFICFSPRTVKNGVETVVVTENGREISRKERQVGQQLTDGTDSYKKKNSKPIKAK